MIYKKHKILLYIGLMLSIVYLLMFMHFSSIDFDENYTLSLVNHNWRQIIHFTSLDVHPPLYYLILKFILSIFTFWTSSLLVKIFVSRLLSIIVSIFSFIFLYKITYLLNIKNNIIISWIGFILTPTLLGITFQFQQMTNIRMYSLAGLLIIMEFYYLLLYRIKQRNSYLIIVIIFASLASYTHYYSAVIAGLLILIYFFKYCIKFDFKNSIKLLLTGISFITLFIPWINSVINQIKNPYTYWMTNAFLTKQIIIYISCILLFIYPIYIYYKRANNKLFNEQILIILNILLSIFVLSIIYGIISHPIFAFRYMYPMLLIYGFIGINIIINLIKINSYKLIHMFYFIIVIILLLLNASVSFIYQIPNYNIPSIQVINNYHLWNKDDNKKIYITRNDVPLDKKYSTSNFENIIYSNNKNRFFVYSDLINSNYSENNIAYKMVFDDISNKVNIINRY